VSAPNSDGTLPFERNKAHGTIPFLLGTAKPVDPGQAGENRYVLMAQNHSLVYYATEVNDVYAYFLKGTKEKGSGIDPHPAQFPSTQQELKAIIHYAAENQAHLRHPETLTMEVKSAWVEADRLDALGLNKDKYITIKNATIPSYRTSTSVAGQTWTFIGTKQADLILLGMHIVGSAHGFPGALWATFEHVGSFGALSPHFSKRFPKKNAKLISQTQATPNLIEKCSSLDPRLASQRS
jgi:hypothetical protein